MVEGSTENATVVRPLITGLRDRGMDASEGVLFVLDGGKALKTAVTNVFGDDAVNARPSPQGAQRHGPPVRGEVSLGARGKLRAAWAKPNTDEAEVALCALANQLKEGEPHAAASLREGLAETVTVTCLGITGSLLKTVMSTNPVESMIEIVRRPCPQREVLAGRRHALCGGRPPACSPLPLSSAE